MARRSPTGAREDAADDAGEAGRGTQQHRTHPPSLPRRANPGPREGRHVAPAWSQRGRRAAIGSIQSDTRPRTEAPHEHPATHPPHPRLAHPLGVQRAPHAARLIDPWQRRPQVSVQDADHPRPGQPLLDAADVALQRLRGVLPQDHARREGDRRRRRVGEQQDPLAVAGGHVAQAAVDQQSRQHRHQRRHHHDQRRYADPAGDRVADRPDQHRRARRRPRHRLLGVEDAEVDDVAEQRRHRDRGQRPPRRVVVNAKATAATSRPARPGRRRRGRCRPARRTPGYPELGRQRDAPETPAISPRWRASPR